MPRTSSDTRLLVFTRAPRPGEVKTRLVPLLGRRGAAALHVQLVKRTLATARSAGIGEIELHCAPDCDDPFFRLCGGRYGVALASQSAGDLGIRMRHALERALACAPRAILIGTDCPVLSAGHLREADRMLRTERDAVFAPAEDGGYVMIGLTRCDARLFERIAWGGANVMGETRRRLAALGWRWEELEMLWDIDRPEDYQRLLACGVLHHSQPPA